MWIYAFRKARLDCQCIWNAVDRFVRWSDCSFVPQELPCQLNNQRRVNWETECEKKVFYAHRQLWWGGGSERFHTSIEIFLGLLLTLVRVRLPSADNPAICVISIRVDCSLDHKPGFHRTRSSAQGGLWLNIAGWVVVPFGLMFANLPVF